MLSAFLAEASACEASPSYVQSDSLKSRHSRAWRAAFHTDTCHCRVHGDGCQRGRQAHRQPSLRGGEERAALYRSSGRAPRQAPRYLAGLLDNTSKTRLPLTQDTHRNNRTFGECRGTKTCAFLSLWASRLWPTWLHWRSTAAAVMAPPRMCQLPDRSSSPWASWSLPRQHAPP